MTAENVTFMLGIPLGFMGIIGLVLLGGSLGVSRRRVIEGLMMAVFYPGMAIFFAVRAIVDLGEQNPLAAAAQAGLAVLMTVQGVLLYRRRVRPDGTRT